MDNGKKKIHSLYFELIRLLLVSATVSLLFFFILNRAGENLLTFYFYESDYVQKASDHSIKNLQEYVTENHVSSNDSEKLTKWVNEQKIVAISVYKEELLTYDSLYPDEEVENAAIEGGYYEWESYYTVEFSDGTADVFLYGFFSYQFYSYALIAEILLAVALFIMTAVLGIRKPVKYIGKLKEECEILGNGNLEYQISVIGKDELADLASGMDHMRRALKESIEKEEELSRANRRMITEMSHDLRTPLTSLLLYTDILAKKEIHDMEQIREYIRKIDRKAHQIKVMSDHIFEYALVTEDMEVRTGEPESLDSIFYDPLSEMAGYLEDKGYRVDVEWKDEDGKICVDPEYINRILDNLVSNIVKYADPEEPVRIRTVCRNSCLGICFSNRILRETDERKESTKIGLHNIRKMMKKMRGVSEVCQEDGMFFLTILFPRTEE